MTWFIQLCVVARAHGVYPHITRITEWIVTQVNGGNKLENLPKQNIINQYFALTSVNYCN